MTFKALTLLLPFVLMSCDTPQGDKATDYKKDAVNSAEEWAKGLHMEDYKIYCVHPNGWSYGNYICSIYNKTTVTNLKCYVDGPCFPAIP